MRIARVIPAIAALFVFGAAFAQDWAEYVNREDFFEINFPEDPAVASVPYKTAKGTSLTAHVYTANAPADSILAGKYTVTVVDYSSAREEVGAALEDAGNMVKARGTVKYDGYNQIDLHLSKRLTVETATARILAEIVMAANNRLYITQAETSLNAPPAANFQASLQILDDKGERIRTRTALGADGQEIPQIVAGGVLDESEQLAAAVTGTWRMAGGTCEAAYFKSGMRVKTKRGESALTGTVANAGVTVSGELVLMGAREGQFINPMNDQAFMLFDTVQGKLRIAALRDPAAGWPEVTLDLCPGSRG